MIAETQHSDDSKDPPGWRTKAVVALAVILGLIVVWNLWGIILPSAPQPTPDYSAAPLQESFKQEANAPDYTVLNVKEISMWTLEKDSKPWRKRFDVSIMAPTATTAESRGQTVVQACRSLQSQYSAHVIRVWLEPNENTRGLGFVLAMATYSPDGKGMTGMEIGQVWDNVSSTDYQLNAKALKMTKDSRLGDISMEQARIIDSRKPFVPFR